ncbi:MAG: hypothetical protein EOP48_33850, partial [Sphingobacteriales bacterium]
MDLKSPMSGISVRQLTWRHLRALHELYIDGKTHRSILDNSYINHLFTVYKLIRYRTGSKKTILALPRYKVHYERNHKEDFERYISFFKEAGLDDDARHRYSESDILTFKFIYENRDELRNKLTTERVFSERLFHSSKYLEHHRGLVKPILQLLDIEEFPEQDPKNNQWRCVVDHLTPVAVVLCENLNYLKQSWLAQKLNIELWYVGGNNIAIVDNIGSDKLKLPLYYSCDWDLAGLKIYSRIKKKMAEKNCQVTLLFP